MWAKSGDSLLTTEWWVDGLHLTIASQRLWFPSCLYSLWLFSQACSVERATLWRRKDVLKPIVSNELRLSAWTADEEANPTKKHWVGSGAESAHCREERMALPIDSNELRHSVWQLMRRQIPPRNTEWAWEQTLFPLNSRMLKFQLTTWRQTVRDPKAWGPAKPFLDSTPTETVLLITANLGSHLLCGKYYDIPSFISFYWRRAAFIMWC